MASELANTWEPQSEIGEEDKQCHATAKSTGKRCRNTGVHKTPKRGWVCDMHGARGGRPPIHGRRSSQYIPAKVRQSFEEFLNDPEIITLDSEIARLRAELANVDEYTGGDAKAHEAVIKLCDAIAKTVERKHKIEHGEQYTITTPQLRVFVARIVTAIADNCPETCPHRDRVADEVEATLGD